MTRVECECGCGILMNELDNYGRKRRFVSGHNNRKYDPSDKHAINKAYVKRNRGKVNKWRKDSSRKRKIELIAILDSKCKSCGLEYNGTNGAVFEFHHVDPETKQFSIGSQLTNTSIKKLKEEVKKCMLLCGNCHAIKHIGEY